MSDAFWANLPLTLTAMGTILSVIIGFWNNRKIEKVHLATNSMKDALVRAEKAVSFDAGVTAADALQNVPSYPRPTAPQLPDHDTKDTR